MSNFIIKDKNTLEKKVDVMMNLYDIEVASKIMKEIEIDSKYNNNICELDRT